MRKFKIISQERRSVPEDVCPADFIIDMGEEAKRYAFIFNKHNIAKIMLGRMTKTIYRNGEDVNIRWPDTDENMDFIEIDQTHTYLLREMNMKTKQGELFELECPFGESSVIILE